MTGIGRTPRHRPSACRDSASRRTPSSLKLLVASSGDATIGNRTTSNASWCGMSLYDSGGANAASFTYGNTGAPVFANECIFASRQSTIPLKFYQGGVSGGNERLRFDASGRIALINARVGIGTATPVASALLELSCPMQGFLPPRMTTTQRDAIASPAEGLMIYNLTDHEPQFWDGSAWVGMP